ncbi:MAG TPA: phenylacetate--CoA ligase [Solirubrobacteraceae bacterium]
MTYDAIESTPREALEALQLERLRATVDRILAAVAPGRARLHEAGVRAGRDIRSLDDVPQLPFTWKSDLREHYPFGLLAVPREQLVRVHASSGTGGKPTVVGYTRHDLDEVWTAVMARSMSTAGVRAGMVVHNAYGYGLFTGGLGFHQGGERLGATVVPISGGLTDRQVMLLRDFGGQALCSTPSYALNIAHGMREAGVDPGDLELEIGLFGAEPWSEAMRTQIESELGLKAFNFYGLSEIVGPGVSAECPERDGLHVNEDHFMVEVVDPDTGARRPPGDDGELVFTTLTKEALPLVRYRTADIAALTFDACGCGRTLARMSPVRGRSDDMLIIRGVNLYPSEVEHALLGVDGVAPHYQLIVDRPGELLDELTINCEPREDGIDRDQLRARIAHALREGIGITVAVELLAPGAVPRSEGKAVRVVDRRRL